MPLNGKLVTWKRLHKKIDLVANNMLGCCVQFCKELKPACARIGSSDGARPNPTGKVAQ